MKPMFFLPGMLALLIVGLALFGGATWFWWPHETPQEQYQRGLVAVADSDWAEVLRAANRLKGQPEFAAEEHLLRGIYFLRTNQPETALKEFGQLNPQGELREPALLNAGEALYRVDRFAEAERMFATLASEQPGHADSHRWLAAIAYDLGNFNHAMDQLGIVIRLQPSDYRPHLLIGQMKFDLEQYRGAIEEYVQAIAKRPPSPVLEQALPALARAQIQNREYPAALESLAQAPRSAEILALEAECQLSLGNDAEARKLIADAEEMDPEQRDMLRLLGRLELDAGHPEAAVAPLRAVLERNPQDHETRHQLAQALRLSGKTAEADTEARRSAQLIELKRELANLTQEAISKPIDADIRDRMAAVCDQIGKTELAASWRKAAAACRQMQPAVMPENRSPAMP